MNTVDDNMQLIPIDLQNSDVMKYQFDENPTLQYYKPLPREFSY